MSSELYGGQDPIALTESACDGNTYWLRDDRPVWLHPADVTIVRDQDGQVVGYVYQPGGTGEQP